MIGENYIYKPDHFYILVIKEYIPKHTHIKAKLIRGENKKGSCCARVKCYLLRHGRASVVGAHKQRVLHVRTAVAQSRGRYIQPNHQATYIL